MEEAGDIVRLSIPLVAGVAAASVSVDHTITAAVSAAGIAISMAACVLQKGGKAVPVLMFMLGAFCRSNYALTGGSGLGILQTLASNTLARLQALIGSMKFEHEITGPMISALLTGNKNALPRETINAFRQSGASHMLALSGLHLGVLYMILGKCLLIFGNSRIGQTARSVLLIAAAAFYTLMTGASPSISRAFLFVCIGEVLKLRRERKSGPMGILCLALSVQLSFRPDVISSAGFQMSYLAMTGICTLYPVMKNWYPGQGSDPFKRLWDMAALAITCQLFTAPVAWLHFHSFPKYFLLTNIIAMPLSSCIMTSAVTTSVLTALGICPEPLLRLTDFLVTCLDNCLGIISSM